MSKLARSLLKRGLEAAAWAYEVLERESLSFLSFSSFSLRARFLSGHYMTLVP